MNKKGNSNGSESQFNPECPPRVLGNWEAFAVVAGSMLGIGIFLAPPIAARHFDSSWSFLGIWIFGGISALGGAVAYSELGAMFPKSGGDYVFQREAFGPSLAFACCWVLLAAVFAGSIAAIASGLCAYQLPLILGMDLSKPLFLDWPISQSQAIAFGLVLFLTFINHLGARLSGGVQVIVALVPLSALLLGSIWVLSSPDIVLPTPKVPEFRVDSSAIGLVAAYLPIYFAYSGWNGVIYVAGEVQNPQRVLPRSLIIGTVVITLLYTLLCAGFLKVLGIQGLREVTEAGSASAHLLAGDTAEYVTTCCVAIALLASLNGSILGSSRVAYAMACGGAIWPSMAQLHPKRKVPSRALWLQALWASLLVFTGSFDQILSLVSVAMVLSGSITVIALFVLRRRYPEQARPYQAMGYPYLPFLYLATNAVVIVVMLFQMFSAESGAIYPLIGLLVLVVMYIIHRISTIRYAR